MSVKRPPASVLTVPEALRGYFYHDASLLSELMKVGIKCLEDTLSTVLRRPIQGGYIVVVQTNGRSGSYNPHLHILVTSGGLAPSRRGGQYWVKLKYLPYEILHKKWQYHLFGMLKEQVGTKEIRMTGIYDTHHYNYRCRDCGYEAKVEDIVVDSFPPSPRSKHRMPELQCFCGGDLCYVKDL